MKFSTSKSRMNDALKTYIDAFNKALSCMEESHNSELLKQQNSLIKIFSKKFKISIEDIESKIKSPDDETFLEAETELTNALDNYSVIFQDVLRALEDAHIDELKTQQTKLVHLFAEKFDLNAITVEQKVLPKKQRSESQRLIKEKKEAQERQTVQTFEPVYDDKGTKYFTESMENGAKVIQDSDKLILVGYMQDGNIIFTNNNGSQRR
jgi:hypothetical protein